MNVTMKHEGIQYDLVLKDGTWTWSFQPIDGPRRFGRVNGDFSQATIVVRRAIEVSMLVNAA